MTVTKKSSVDLEETTKSSVDLEETKKSSVDLEETKKSSVDLEETKKSGMDLEETKKSSVDLEETKKSGMDLEKTKKSDLECYPFTLTKEEYQVFEADFAKIKAEEVHGNILFRERDLVHPPGNRILQHVMRVLEEKGYPRAFEYYEREQGHVYDRGYMSGRLPDAVLSKPVQGTHDSINKTLNRCSVANALVFGEFKCNSNRSKMDYAAIQSTRDYLYRAKYSSVPTTNSTYHLGGTGRFFHILRISYSPFLVEKFVFDSRITGFPSKLELEWMIGCLIKVCMDGLQDCPPLILLHHVFSHWTA